VNVLQCVDKNSRKISPIVISQQMQQQIGKNFCLILEELRKKFSKQQLATKLTIQNICRNDFSEILPDTGEIIPHQRGTRNASKKSTRY